MMTNYSVLYVCNVIFVTICCNMLNMDSQYMVFMLERKKCGDYLILVHLFVKVS